MAGEHIGDLSGVQATLLIPLSARVLAHIDRPDLGFRDEHAEAIVAALGIDAKEYCTFPANLVLSAFRSMCYDDAIADFCLRHPDGVVLNLACGLSTTYDRLGQAVPSSAHWFDVDLSDVIAIRRRFFTDTSNRQMVSADLTKHEPLASALGLRHTRPAIIVLEGILFYLEAEQVETIFRTIASTAAGETNIVFDFVSAAGGELANASNPDLLRTGARFRWPYRGIEQLQQWDRSLTQVWMKHQGDYVPDFARPLFFGALERDGLPLAGVVQVRRGGNATATAFIA